MMQALFSTLKCLMFVLVLISNTNAQITYPNSVLFGTNSPFSIGNSPQPQQQPTVVYQQTSPGLSMGGTSADIIQQNNMKAMQAMGYRPPIVPPSDPAAANQFIINQYKQSSAEQQMAEYQAMLKEDIPVTPINIPENNRPDIVKGGNYKSAFDEVMDMYHGKVPYSLKRLIFIVEHAYDTTLKYSTFNKQINDKVRLIKKVLKDERIPATNSLGVNYAIQKLFSERIVEYKDTVVWRVYKPFQYDFEDFFGEHNWSKMFVSKLLRTGKGQCHSMPLLYLILAEEMKAKAWLTLAPEHSFVIFSDNNLSNFYNYETTIGSPTSMSWVMQSGYINSNAIKSRIYLDTLGRNELLACCLADLIMGYTNKSGYDNFMVSMVNELIKINPKSVQGQIFRGDILAARLNISAKKRKITSQQQFAQYPEVNEIFLALEEQREMIEALGYAHIPKEKYEAWRLSLDDEKKRMERQRFKNMVISNAKGK